MGRSETPLKLLPYAEEKRCQMIGVLPYYGAFRFARKWIYVLIGFDSIFWIFLLLQPVKYDTLVVIDDILQCIGPLLAGMLCLAYCRRHTIATYLVGLGILVFAIGQVIWSYQELLLNQAPFPSVADVAFLASYAFLLPGILRLPMRPTILIERFSVLLDGLIIMTIIVIVNWHFVLKSTLLLHGDSLLARAIGTAYPCLDLMLLFCVLLIWGDSEDQRTNPGQLVLMMGLVAIVIADSLFDYLNIHNIYATGNVLDPLWSVGYQCIALGVIVQQRIPRSFRRGSAQPLCARRYRMLSWILLLALGGLVFQLLRTKSADVEEVIGIVLLSGMVCTRLVVTWRQHIQRQSSARRLTETQREIKMTEVRTTE